MATSSLRVCALASAWLVGAAVPAAAAPAALVEQQSRTPFPEQVRLGGEAYECLGTGLRKVFIVRAYAMAFCVATSEQQEIDGYLARTHPGLSGQQLTSAIRKDREFFRLLATSGADKLVVMKALRNIPAEKLRETFRDSLAGVLPKASIERLLTVLKTDVREGETVRLRSAGNRVFVDIGAHQEVVEDPEVARKLWLVWLGPDSVTPSLKEDIAARLGRRTPGPGER